MRDLRLAVSKLPEIARARKALMTWREGRVGTARFGEHKFGTREPAVGEGSKQPGVGQQAANQQFCTPLTCAATGNIHCACEIAAILGRH